jgi:cysteinyl-tRNA synthetase
MSTKYLGNHFDIHGGGMDLKVSPSWMRNCTEACTGQTPLITDACKHADFKWQNGKSTGK